MRAASVFEPAARRSPFLTTPCVIGAAPVKSDTWLGSVVEAAAYDCAKRTPCAASAASCGEVSFS
jgi:hypothetical protein